MQIFENRQIYSAGPATEHGYKGVFFREIIDRRLKTAPDKPLYTWTDYRTGERSVAMPADFKADCEAVSTWLYESGHRRAHMAVMGDNSYAYVTLMFSIVSSDNVVVPIDKNTGKEALCEMLKWSDCSILFYSSSCEEKAKEAEEKLGITLYRMEDWKQMVEKGKELLQEGKDACLTLPMDLDAPAFLFFTSGTTGGLKGVMLSQKNMVSDNVLDQESGHFDWDVVLYLPLHHALGFSSANIPHIIAGNTIHLNSNLRYMYRDLQAENPEGEILVPLMLQNMYELLWKRIRENGKEEAIRAQVEENRKNPNLTMAEKRAMFADELSIFGTRLQAIYQGGAAQNVEYYYGFKEFGIEVYVGYGSTETSPIVTNQGVDRNKPGSVGKVMNEVEIKIDEPNSEKEGEICVRGPIVMVGYYKDEAATKEVLQDGWYHTGDLGYIDEDGYLFITGRKKNLIILANGENVSPEALEDGIGKNPLVKEVVVYEKGQKIAAQIYLNEDLVKEKGTDESEKEVREFIAEQNRALENHKQISIVEFRKTPFERTSTNKIKRSSVE